MRPPKSLPLDFLVRLEPAIAQSEVRKRRRHHLPDQLLSTSTQRTHSLPGRPMTPASGYSGTPLPQKLGLRDGQRVLFIGLPRELETLATAARFKHLRQAGWGDWQVGEAGYDLIHGFTASRQTLQDNAGPLMQCIDRNGMVWISWPKKAAKVDTDITEDVIRDVVLPIGLVDVKVAAIDATWSGLKLVIRKELR